MMTNLFSSFDPSTKIMSLNWMSSLLIFILLPLNFWLLPSRTTMFWNKLTITIHKELSTLTKSNKKMNIIFVSLLLFILINNSLGIFPYIFTSSAHLSFTLTMALPLWLSFMIFGWFNYTFHMFAHLLPKGTPPLLMPFMVCIETISNLIRPGTLAIRLMANMIAGHLLMTLLGNTSSILPLSMIWLLLLTQILLLTLESAVAMIQSYVFTILSTLYSTEVK